MQLRNHKEDSDVESEEAEQVHDEHPELPKPLLRNHRLPLTCLCIDSQDEHAFTGSKDGSIIKWCLKTSKIVSKISPIKKKIADLDEELAEKYHTNRINCLAISSDDKFLASAGSDPKIRLWSPKDMSWIHTFSMHRREVTALAFRKGHHDLYSASKDRSVMVWTLEDDENRSFVEALYGHESEVTSMDTLHKERVLTSGGRDQSIRIWKLAEQAQTVFQSKHESVDVARYIDDKTFVSGGEDGSIIVWTTMKRSPLCIVQKAHGSGENSQKPSSDNIFNRHLSFWITSLAVYPIKTGKSKKSSNPRKKRKLGHESSVAVEDDNEDDGEPQSDGPSETDETCDDNQISTSRVCLALVASGSCDSQLLIWKLIKTSGKHSLEIHQTIDCPGFINDLRFTSDGTRLLAACGQEHRSGRWWKLHKTKNCLRNFEVNKL